MLFWSGKEECEPQRVHDGDAGFDLVVAEGVEIEPGEFVDVDCGIKVQMPPMTWAILTGRSSTLRKRGLLVNMGIIDNGYRGQVFAGVWNLNGEVAVVEKGARIAQLIPLPLTAVYWTTARMEEGQLTPSSRGERGFGSTGK